MAAARPSQAFRAQLFHQCIDGGRHLGYLLTHRGLERVVLPPAFVAGRTLEVVRRDDGVLELALEAA